MKVYISGKIGEDVLTENTRQKFAKAEQMLKERGFETFNPCSKEWQMQIRNDYARDSKTYQPYIAEGVMPDFYAYALLRDETVLATTDAIYMLPDFLDSKGAKAEHAFAIATGKQVFYADELFTKGIIRCGNWLPDVAPTK